jgi:hypothetical protein
VCGDDFWSDIRRRHEDTHSRRFQISLDIIRISQELRTQLIISISIYDERDDISVVYRSGISTIKPGYMYRLREKKYEEKSYRKITMKKTK